MVGRSTLTMPSTSLHRFLDAAVQQGPEYRGGLSSHLPMALHALAELGAQDSQLERFARHYLARTGMETFSDTPAALKDWRAGLGRLDQFGALQATFAQSIGERGMRQAVADALPALWPGVAAAAFHGLIRVAHAWEAGHPGELAAAMAYWAARWQAMPAPEQARDLALEGWWAAAERAAAQWQPAGPLILDDMAAAATSQAFLADAARLQPGADAVARTAAWAAGLYAASGNFTILHVVTGLRAVNALAALATPPEVIWNAVFAAVQSSHVQRQPVHDLAEAPDWAELSARACRSDNEHVVKLVHACTQWDGLHAHPHFIRAAVRALASTR